MITRLQGVVLAALRAEERPRTTQEIADSLGYRASQVGRALQLLAGKDRVTLDQRGELKWWKAR